MGKSKSTQQQTTANTYAYAPAPPKNPYYDSAEQLISGYDGGAGGYREGAMRAANDINESGNDVFGAYTPDYVRDRTRQSRLFKNDLDLGAKLGQANQDETAYKNAGFMSLGGATAAPLVQTGGSMTGSGTQTQAPIQTALGIGQLASA